jgi:hypothetical protein
VVQAERHGASIVHDGTACGLISRDDACKEALALHYSTGRDLADGNG